MAFHLWRDQRDDTEITVVDQAVDTKRTLTSLTRQDDLFSKGFAFEASIARAAMVEGLCLHYLLLAKAHRGAVVDQVAAQRMKDERITFGQLKDALVKARALPDPKLETELRDYVAGRNHLAHHAASGGSSFDFQVWFDSGRRLALALWKEIRAEIERINPPP